MRRCRGAAGRGARRAAALVAALLAGFAASAAGQEQGEPRDTVVRGLSFSGNRAIDDYRLRVSIATSNSSFFARVPLLRAVLGTKRYFREDDFRRDVLRIEALYKASGFVNVQVDTTVHRNAESVSLEFHIREGEPVRITLLRVEGTEDVIPERRVLQRLPIAVGDRFDRFRLQAAVDTIRAMVRNRGYPFAEVFRNFDEDRERLTAQVHFQVDPGPFARLERIEIVGNEEFDDKVVRRMLSVREGQPFSQRALEQSQLDLYRIGVFNYASVSLRDSLPDSPEDSLVTVLVQLSEGALRRLRLGAGYGTVDCFRTQSSWTLHNFMGDAQTLELDGRLSRIGAGSPTSAGFEENVCPGLRSEDPRFLRLNYRFTATFRERFLFDRRTSATLAVSAERRSELTAYLREAYGGELSVTRQTPVRIPVTVSYSAFIDRTSADPATFCTFLDVCDLASTDIFTEFRLRSMVSLGLVRDRTDSPLDATRGSLLRVDLRHASTVLGSDTLRQFTKGVVDLAAHYRVGRGSVFSWRVRLGGVTSPRLQLTGERPRFVPPEERFYAGGATTVRGFSQNELGPLVRVVQIDSNGTVVRLRDRQGQVFDSLIGRLRTSPTGGDALLIGNAEYRFPIGRRLSGALFVDAGQVLQRDGGDGGSDLRITPGVGLRLASPIGPIRLDIGFNPYPPQSGPLFAVEPGGTELVRVTDPAGVPVSFAPERGFLGRLRVHFSVGQPF